jgi:hypothetical protein
MYQLIKVWSILLLLPLIPVIILYKLFASWIFFELQDTAKGLVASGPIAAYFGLIYAGWNIYKKMGRPQDPLLDHLVGDWTIASASVNGPRGTGTCYIKNDGGELTISGDFQSQDNQETGNWHCEMVKVKNNRLLMAYSLTTVRKTVTDTLDGITILTFGNQPIKRMTGIWIVVGKENMSGSVVYTKI